MPVNSPVPDCCDTLISRSPSRTHGPARPAKVIVENLLSSFCCLAIACSGGARNSPQITASTISKVPAMATEPATRHTDRPAARITVSSLPRASEPSPISEPMRTPMGSSSYTCCGMFSTTNQKASSAL